MYDQVTSITTRIILWIVKYLKSSREKANNFYLLGLLYVDCTNTRDENTNTQTKNDSKRYANPYHSRFSNESQVYRVSYTKLYKNGNWIS